MTKNSLAEVTFKSINVSDFFKFSRVYIESILSLYIVCIKVSTSPQKHHVPLFFVKLPHPSPIKSLSYILILCEPSCPLKIRFFCEPQKCLNFSSLTLSYALKVSKFLVKIFQLKFLIMIEKKNYAYKLFLS